MTDLKNLFAIIFVIAAIISVTLGCGGANTGNNTATVDTTAPKGSPGLPTTSKPQPPKDISGEYDATGTNPDGGGSYSAKLVVTPRDDVWQFSWDSGQISYEGVGVMTASAVAVSYTEGKDGKGCGVVLYKINADGSLDGKSGYWGVNKAESERAVRVSGTDLEGRYKVTGINTDGENYEGTLDVKKDGSGYAFNWKTGDSFAGFGIRAENLIAVGFGGSKCAFVGYDVKADGTLDGKWGSQATNKFGTEVAERR